jgi:hypothetical protein
VVPVVFPETFTAYQMLQAGNQACARCHTMFTTGLYRRKCYIIKDGVFTEISDVLGFLSSMPEPPYVLYLTKAKRKHGWINAVRNPILNTEQFILCVDEDKIFFDRTKFAEYLVFLETLWAREVPKGILLVGYPNARSIRKFGFSREECLLLEKLQSDRLWQFVVAFKKYGEIKV